MSRIAFWSSLGNPRSSPGGNVASTTLSPGLNFFLVELVEPEFRLD